MPYSPSSYKCSSLQPLFSTPSCKLTSPPFWDDGQVSGQSKHKRIRWFGTMVTAVRSAMRASVRARGSMATTTSAGVRRCLAPFSSLFHLCCSPFCLLGLPASSHYPAFHTLGSPPPLPPTTLPFSLTSHCYRPLLHCLPHCLPSYLHYLTSGFLKHYNCHTAFTCTLCLLPRHCHCLHLLPLEDSLPPMPAWPALPSALASAMHACLPPFRCICLPACLASALPGFLLFHSM